MDLRKLSASLAVCAGILIASQSSAEVAKVAKKGPAMAPNVTVWTRPANSPDFGTQDLIFVRVPGTEMTPFNSADGYVGVGGSIGRYPVGGPAALEAVPHIPSGAIIDYFEFDFCDSNVAGDVSAFLLDCGPLGASCATLISTVSSSGNPGCTVVSASGIGYLASNANSSFDVEMLFGATDGSISAGSIVIGYHLQVSPAPLTPTFTDVPADSIYYQFIEALAASGVTAGCDLVPNYCPDRPITRAEMAVFMAKALGLHFPN